MEEKEQRLGVAEAKPELNFSPCSVRPLKGILLSLVLLFRFQVTLESHGSLSGLRFLSCKIRGSYSGLSRPTGAWDTVIAINQA